MEIAAESGPAVLTRPAIGRDEKFFFISAIVMAVVVVAGFGLNLVAGRSSFAVPARFHIHAVLFFGWTTLYVLNFDALPPPPSPKPAPPIPPLTASAK